MEWMNVHSIRRYAKRRNYNKDGWYIENWLNENHCMCVVNVIKAHSYIHTQIWRRRTIHNRQQILALHLEHSENRKNAKHLAMTFDFCSVVPLHLSLPLDIPSTLYLSSQAISSVRSLLHTFRMIDALSKSSSMFSPIPHVFALFCFPCIFLIFAFFFSLLCLYFAVLFAINFFFSRIFSGSVHSVSFHPFDSNFMCAPFFSTCLADNVCCCCRRRWFFFRPFVRMVRMLYSSHTIRLMDEHLEILWVYALAPIDRRTRTQWIRYTRMKNNAWNIPYWQWYFFSCLGFYV